MLVICSEIGPDFADVSNILGYTKGAKGFQIRKGVTDATLILCLCLPGVWHYRTGLLPKVITPGSTGGRRIYVPDQR
jgi:hypothetical protein